MSLDTPFPKSLTLRPEINLYFVGSGTNHLCYLLFQDFGKKATNCIELDLPVSSIDNIYSAHVKILSSVDTDVQKNLIKKSKPVSKQEVPKKGFTAIITFPEYKDSLLQSKLLKSKPK